MIDRVLAALANFIAAYSYTSASTGKIPIPYPTFPSPGTIEDSIAAGLQLIEHARSMAAENAAKARQKVEDLEVAAKNASKQTKDKIDIAKAEAEKKAEEEQSRVDTISAVIGNISANLRRL